MVAGRGLALAAAFALHAASAAALADRPAPELYGHEYAAALEPYTPRLLYDADHFETPYVLQADRTLLDMPTSRATLYGAARDVGDLPRVADGGNAGVSFPRLARGGLVPVVDSFARPFASLRQDGAAVRVYTQRRRFFDRTVPHHPVAIVLQGLGCMADARDHRRYAIVGLRSGADTAPNNRRRPPDVGVRGHNIGIRGFVPVAALPRRVAGYPTAGLLRTHDVGCGSGPAAAGRVVQVPARQGWQRFADLYYGAHSWPGCPIRDGRPDPEAATCGTPYAQYEAPPGLTPPGEQVSLLTANTTGVTGTHAGVVRALYRAGPMRVVDAIGYADPNVPCGAGARAQWFFGDVNPRGKHRIWGWRPQRVAGAAAAWGTLAPGLLARPCGSEPPREELFEHPTGPCPPAGARLLASSRAARVYRLGATTFVCDRSSLLHEPLDDPETNVRLAGSVDLAGGRVADATRSVSRRGEPFIGILVLDVAAYVGDEGAGRGAIVETPAVGTVGSVRLYRGGAAYIGCVASACSVHVLGPGLPGPDTVAATGRIAPRSLRVVGGRLRWTTRN